MSRTTRRYVATGLAAVLLPLTGGTAAAAASPGTERLDDASATYRLIVRDTVAGGELTEEYEQVLEVEGRTYAVADRRLAGLEPNTRVRVDATVAGGELTLSSADVVQPATAATTAVTTTRDLVILAHWDGPDAMTQETAQAEVANDDAWFKEVSYGTQGLTAVATPFVKIPARSSCVEAEILADARAAAKALGPQYDSASFDRTLVYSPRTTLCRFAGSSFVGADWSMYNGSLSTSMTTHEQGHQLGLYHAHAPHCFEGGKQVVVTYYCSEGDNSGYGDKFDTMGGGGAVHYNGAEKDRLGWLGARKVVLTPGTSTVLAPLEQQGVATQVAEIASGGNRTYFLEYRQRLGFDVGLNHDTSTQPGTYLDRVTDGVLIHSVDDLTGYGDGGTSLLDLTPDGNVYDATLKAGRSWTTPEGVTISVGALTPAGAQVSVTRPAPKAPSAPTGVSAAAGDGRATVSWTAASDGGSAITGYRVTASPGGASVPADPWTRSATVPGLANGTPYTFTVTASNAVGSSPASSASPAVTPVAAPVSTPVQESALQLKGWSAVAEPTANGGAYRSSATAGDSASFAFTGTGVTWLTRGGPAAGKAQVLLDGVSKGTVDLYRTSAGPLSFTWRLVSKAHTLVVKPLGTRSTASTGAAVAVDGFTVGTATTQESAPKVAYSGWTGATSASASGGAYRTSRTAGATATWRFTGTAVDWVTATGPAYGKAQVLVDGVLKGTFDQYARAAQWKVARSVSGLAAGPHTIQVKVLGTRSTASTGTAVVVDAVVAR